MFMTDKFPRIMHFPFSQGAKNDDRIADFDWLDYYLSHDYVFTEKLDGSNSMIDSVGVYGRSHAVTSHNEWDSHLWRLQAEIGHDLGNLQIFGENMYAVHSIEYNNLSSYFYVFAVRENGKWFSYEDTVLTAKYFNLKLTPKFDVIDKPKTENELEALILSLVRKSSFGDVCEGVVMRNIDSFYSDDDNMGYDMLKWVRKNHVQTDEHWTRHWDKAKLKI